MVRVLGAFLILGICLIAGSASAGGKVDGATLVGTWKVDLRSTPGAPDYYQQFVVTKVDGDTFEGTFYGAPLSEGRLNRDWGKVSFAFVTSDQSGEYHHSGTLSDGRIDGLSHSIGRKFLAVWSARLEPPATK